MAEDTPAPDVLLELGHLTWEAILLEDAVYFVCNAIDGDGQVGDEPPVSSRIAAARSALSGEFDSEVRERTDSWLEASGKALQRRNDVLHGVPFLFERLPGMTQIPGAPMQHLVHYPRKGKGVTVQLAMTVGDLRPLVRQLHAARAGGLELGFELFRLQPDAGDPSD